MEINSPKFIIVHDSDSRGGSEQLIAEDHMKPVLDGGKGWDRVGYHYVVGNGYDTWGGGGPYTAHLDGEVQAGLEESVPGIHCYERGMNYQSLGVCLIGPRPGPEPYSHRQLEVLRAFVMGLMLRYGIPASNVLGHKELKSSKSDPHFDMDAFRASLEAPSQSNPPPVCG